MHELMRIPFTRSVFDALALPRCASLEQDSEDWMAVHNALNSDEDLEFVVTRGPDLEVVGAVVMMNFCQISRKGNATSAYGGAWLDPLMDQFDLPWPELRCDLIILDEWYIGCQVMPIAEARSRFQEYVNRIESLFDQTIENRDLKFF